MAKRNGQKGVEWGGRGVEWGGKRRVAAAVAAGAAMATLGVAAIAPHPSSITWSKPATTKSITWSMKGTDSITWSAPVIRTTNSITWS